MTEKELSGLKYLNRKGEILRNDLNKLKDNLQEIEASMGVRSQKLVCGPKGSLRFDVSDLVSSITDLKESILETEAAIVRNLVKIQRERARLEEYIGGIEDTETGFIFRLRHINGMTWREIGEEMHMSLGSVYGKHKAYLKK